MRSGTVLALGLLLAALFVLPPSAALAQTDGTEETLDARIERLVGQLADPSYDVREQAMRQLVEIGPPAMPALDEAAASTDPEVRWRAEEARRAIREGGLREEQQAQTPDGPPEPGTPRNGLDFQLRLLPGIPEELRRALERDLGVDVDRLFGGRLDEMFRELERRMNQDFQIPPPTPAPQPDPGAAPQPGQGPSVFRFRDGQWEVVTPPSGVERDLGIRTSAPSDALRAHLPIPAGQGVQLDEVDPNGTAALGGLQAYDIVLDVNGQPARNAADLAPLGRPGDVSLHVLRHGQIVEQHYTVAGAPAPGAPRPEAPAPPSQPGRSERF